MSCGVSESAMRYFNSKNVQLEFACAHHVLACAHHVLACAHHVLACAHHVQAVGTSSTPARG